MHPSGDESEGAGQVPREDALEELLVQFLERAEIEGTGHALDALCDAHPGHAAALRDAAQQLVRAGLSGTQADVDRPPEVLGEFRPLHALGAGGMGIVYLAEQPALGRRVAVKLVRPEQLWFGDARPRFHREVESVARLSHPGVAAVYTSGEQDGLPYFAQEFVPGVALDALLSEVGRNAPERLTARDLAHALERTLTDDARAVEPGEPDPRFFSGTWEAVCVRIVRAATLALEHAHARGVLHRDVKPSNLLLCPSGRVVLVDFGLASLGETDDRVGGSEGARLTRTGSMLGSMPYMSPEQLEGQRVGPAADVYALGVTLYELATLSPPYFSRSPESLRHQILEARPTPPRARNRALSTDLETVCLCAMDPDPARRYPSMAAFAGDLSALLDRRPIAARPAGRVRRARRWFQRNPARGVAALLALLLAVGGPVGYGAVQRRNANAVRRLNDELRVANESTERHYGMAVRAIVEVLQQFGLREIVEMPRATPIRLKAVDRSLELFAELVDERPGDHRLRERLAWTHRMRGDVLFDLGRLRESVREYELHGEILVELLDVEPTPARLWELAGGLSQRARTLSDLGDNPEALELYGEAAARLERAIDQDPDRPGWRVDLLTVLSNRGMSLVEAGRVEEAQPLFERVLQDAEPLLEVLPERAELWGSRARALLGLASDQVAGRTVEERRDLVARAQDSFRTALRWSGDYELRLSEMGCRVRQVSDLAENLGDRAAAGALVRELARDAQALVDDYPAVPSCRDLLCEAYGLDAFLQHLAGNEAAARAGLEEVARQRTERAALLGSVDARAAAAGAWANLSNTVSQSQDLPREERMLAARGYADRALEQLAREEGGTLRSTDLRRFLCWALYNRVLASTGLDDVDAAAADLARYEENLLGGAAAARYLADAWCEQLLALLRVGASDDRRAEAADQVMTYLERAVDQGFRDVQELSTTPALEPLRADPRFVALLERVRQAR